MSRLLPWATCLQIGYLQIGPIGPVPGLHEPVWCPENTLSVVAEPVVMAGTTAGMALGLRTRDIGGASRDERRW